MKKPYSKAKFDRVAKLLVGSERITASPAGMYATDGLFDGVVLREGAVFTMMYAQKNGGDDTSWVRGITGFVFDNQCYDFDRRGIEDSWYPDGFDGPKKAEDIVEEMKKEIDRAKERHAAHVKRQAEGKTVNFGPVSRTLMPAEIEKFKATIRARKSFDLNPSGFGQGYRFYVGHARNRYGQGVPASAEARQLLEAPGLVYDTTDHD